MFAALGDETRLLLLAKLCSGQQYSIAELTEGTRLTRQAVTKHLRVLERVRMVHGSRAGRQNLFEFDPKPVNEMKEYLELVSRQWDGALARLKTFVESDRQTLGGALPATNEIKRSKTMTSSSAMRNGKVEKKRGYAPVNGLSMYYEVQGTGKPLVYIPMGFGVAGTTELPALTQNRKSITFDLQGRGRTADIDRPLSFEQQADDVIALLKHLRIEQADFLGECVGGVVAILVAIRHPELVGRVVTYGSVFGKFQDAYKPEILAHVMSLTPDSEAIRFQRENYERVAPDPAYWPAIWSKFNSLQWNGFSHEDLTRLEAPVLIAVGDHDWVRLEHALEIYSLIPNGELAVIPDAGHFALDAEPRKVLPVFEAFLDAPATRLPFATTAIGYQPGAAR